jgi:hypothetical protein
MAPNADIPIIINLSEYVGGNSSPIAPNAHIDKAPEAKLEPTIVIANSIDLIPLDKTGLTTLSIHYVPLLRKIKNEPKFTI